jgi:ABC-type multidrug transport system fused ATPase/permease subunit
LADYYEISDLKNAQEWVRKIVLEAFKEEYKEIGESWKSIETKAQGNIAIAGIFIAGAFGFLKDILPQMDYVEKWAFVLIIGFLVVSVLLSIISLQVRTVPEPPLGKKLNPIGKDLIDNLVEATYKEQLGRFINEYIILWQDYVTQAKKKYSCKSKYLVVAQWFVLVAVIVIALLIVSRVFGIASKIF